jgi:uncharacterized protein
MNATAVLIFAFSAHIAWRQAGVMAIAAIAGGQLGAWLFRRVYERRLRIVIVVLGLVLTVGLLLRQHR